MKQAELNPAGPNPAPQAPRQMAAVAELRWRIFVNSLHTFRGRLELASRIFVGIAFVAGGIGGAVGLGGAAWFLMLEENAEWLGALLWPVFLFWQLFPLMATAFTKNLESASLLRFPLSYRSYFLRWTRQLPWPACGCSESPSALEPPDHVCCPGPRLCL